MPQQPIYLDDNGEPTTATTAPVYLDDRGEPIAATKPVRTVTREQSALAVIPGYDAPYTSGPEYKAWLQSVTPTARTTGAVVGGLVGGIPGAMAGGAAGRGLDMAIDDTPHST